ncbi:MAG: tetratricopeptide repeat protein, partial [Anaerolineae bacterium]
MSELVSLRCPNCGAPAHQGDAQCGYCGSALLITRSAEIALPAVTEAQKLAARMRERITANPYDGDAYYQLGLACYTLQLYPQAENAFQQAIRFLPGSALPHYFTALAILHSEEQEILSIREFRLNQARLELNTAVKVDPTLLEVQAYFLFVKGLLARAEGNYQDAIKPLGDAVKLLPTLDLAWKVLAACYFQVGRYKDAIEAGKKTQELRPTDDGNAYLVGA